MKDVNITKGIEAGHKREAKREEVQFLNVFPINISVIQATGKLQGCHKLETCTSPVSMGKS